MIDMTKQVTTITTEEYSAEVSGDQLKEYLGLPKNAKVSFMVPGGGDWSNEEIDITEEDPLHVSYEVVTEEMSFDD